MFKHTETIRRQQPTNCLIVFEHFVGLALKVYSNLEQISFIAQLFIIAFIVSGIDYFI